MLPDLGRTLVMGVVNVTPDSFSEAGRFYEADAAILQGLALVASGADIIDIGGESTRPGAGRVDAAEECRRIMPVIAALSEHGIYVSVDTMRYETARAALDAGAQMVNDVSGGLADEKLPGLVAEAGVPYVVMHWRGHSADMQSKAVYDDVVGEVCAELTARFEALVAAGVDASSIILDPGLGFAKTAEHNWSLLAQLDRLVSLGPPLLIGASRKSFLGSLLADEEGPRPVDERDDATAAISTVAATAGAWGVRVHEVAASADAVRVVAAIRAAR